MTSLDFYKTVPLSKMSDSEWELLCDGCGLCCFRKFITGRGKRQKTHFTRIACDLLDLKTGKCTDYENRFKKQAECVHLTKNNVGRCDWLPESCAYRRLYYKQNLPDWHPLVSGRAESVRESGVQIQNGIHECDVDEADWEEYVITYPR